MKRTYAKHRKHLPNRRGATVVLMVVMMVVIIAIVAFATEVGRMFLLRSEVQNAVDAGALAAALHLRDFPNDVPKAKIVARQFVQRNRAGSSVKIPNKMIDIETGIWDGSTRTFTANPIAPNAVRVFARQNEPFFFGRIFGQTKFAAPASAIASRAEDTFDIVMVLDLSGSMESKGRIEALQNAAPAFVQTIKEFATRDQIGVMGYGTELGDFEPGEDGNGIPYTGYTADEDEWVGVLEGELREDYTDLKTNVLSTSNLLAKKYGGGTPIGAALRDGSHYVVNAPTARSSVEKIVVFMSDGHANKPDDAEQYARDMAYYAVDLGVTVHTISLGDSADLVLMQEIADIAGGQHFDATGSGEGLLTKRLNDAFVDIALLIKRARLVD